MLKVVEKIKQAIKEMNEATERDLAELSRVIPLKTNAKEIKDRAKLTKVKFYYNEKFIEVCVDADEKDDNRAVITKALNKLKRYDKVEIEYKEKVEGEC